MRTSVVIILHLVFFSNICYIGQTKRQMKARVDEHPRKVENEEISSIASHFWPYYHNFDFSKANIVSSPFFSFHSNFHEAFCILNQLYFISLANLSIHSDLSAFTTFKNYFTKKQN